MAHEGAAQGLGRALQVRLPVPRRVHGERARRLAVLSQGNAALRGQGGGRRLSRAVGRRAVRVLAVYVGSMKKHLKVMRKAKAVTNGLLAWGRD